MSFYLTVESGDHMAKIADENGFYDWRTIWDAPENAELKQSRDPNLLKPGDRVFIPDKQPKSVSAATGASHKFTVSGKGMRLVLKLRDSLGQPLKNVAVTVTVEKRPAVQMTTDGEGGLKIPIESTDAEATIEAGAYEYDLRIGHLDPVDEKSGLVARLRNLGYLIDAPDENDADGHPTAEALAFAVELFQKEHQLPVDGSDLDGIRAKLEEIHGC
jgi:hypothetical protein